MAVLMGLLIIFTVIWLRKRLLRPLALIVLNGAGHQSGKFTHRVNVRGRNEMATLGIALNAVLPFQLQCC